MTVNAVSSSHWTKPLTRPPLIDTLVQGVDRYNPQNLEILDEYLDQQLQNREYDCLANLAILKLYQFNAELYNGDVVVNILVKALTATPAPDFNLCLSLLGERMTTGQTDETDPLPLLLPQLQYLYTLLRTCRFPLFWETYESQELSDVRGYTTGCVGFQDSVRDVVVRVVRSTFTKIGRARLENYLNLHGSSFDHYLSSLGWTLHGDTVTVPPNQDNQIQATVIREDIQLPQLVKILAHSQLA